MDVQLTAVFDCCHSGTILDLPFEFKAPLPTRSAALTKKDAKYMRHLITEVLQNAVLVAALAGIVAFKILRSKKGHSSTDLDLD